MTQEEKRDALRERIEAAEERNTERSLGDMARDAADTATEFVKEHPLATVAGVTALGLAVGAMTRPGRRAGRRAGRKAGALATYATELGLAYASGLFDAAGDAARAGKEKLEDFSDTISDSTRDLQREAGYRSSIAREGARRLTREAGKKTGRRIRDLRSRMTH